MTDETTSEEDDCYNLDETEQYAFRLAIKEVIRKTVDENEDELIDGKNDLIERIDSYKRDVDDGIYRLDSINYNVCDRNHVLKAVAYNPIIQVAKIYEDAAILVHADYLDEFYEMINEEEDDGK